MMISEIYKQLDFLRDECLENYKERDRSFTEKSVESMYNETKNIITELIPVRHSRKLSIDVINKHMSQSDPMEWQQVEVWLFQLTDMDNSFVYAYNYLAQEFNRENKWEGYKIKDVSKNDLRALLENDNSDSSDNTQNYDNKESTTQKITPTITFTNPELIYDILAKFFPEDQRHELHELLVSGNTPSRRLFFQDAGNRLTDLFKKLIEHDFIIGIDKEYIQKWIVENFTYLKKKESEFNIQTVAKYISRKSIICKYPLIVVEKGEIKRSNIPKTRKDNYQ